MTKEKFTVSRYKVSQWLDIDSGETFFGVMAKINKFWFPVCNGPDDPLFFYTRDKAQEYVNQINNPVRQIPK